LQKALKAIITYARPFLPVSLLPVSLLPVSLLPVSLLPVSLLPVSLLPIMSFSPVPFLPVPILPKICNSIILKVHYNIFIWKAQLITMNTYLKLTIYANNQGKEI